MLRFVPLWRVTKSSLPTPAINQFCETTHWSQYKVSQLCRLYASRARSPTHFYDVLGLTPSATQKQIKTAYYQLSKQCHPDMNPSSDSHGKFTQISEAYETLGNLTKKRAYDRGRTSQYYGTGGVGEDYYRPQGSPFRARKPPPTGRTAQYNFDEFYRQHYADQIRAEQIRRENEQERIEYFRNLQRQRQLVRQMLGMVMFFWFVGAVVSAFSEPRPGTGGRR